MADAGDPGPVARPPRGGPQRIPRPPGTRVGDRAPWADLGALARRPDVDAVVRALAAGPPPKRSPLEAVSTRASGVLAPLYEEGGEVHVVLTRRAWHMRSHTGEVSFPGGRQEEGDATLWDTALREAREEVDLTEPVRRIGELDHLATVTSRSFIVPHVGLLDGRPDLTANPDEVDAVLHVPLAELLAEGVYHQERWGIPALPGTPRSGLVERPIHFFELEGDTVWGATAAMLVDLLTRITDHAR